MKYTKTGAQKGTTLGTQNALTGLWQLASGDQTAIQGQIVSALNGTNFNLSSLSAAQVATLAQAKFGASVNLTVNSNTNVADNAVRVNFVDASNNNNVGSVTAVNQNNYSNAQQLFTAIDPTLGASNAANPGDYWTTRLSSLSSYSYTGLTDAQKALNNAAVQNAKFGTQITIYVYPASTVQAFNASDVYFDTFNSVNNEQSGPSAADAKADAFANGQNGNAYVETAAGSRVPFTTLRNAFAAAVRAPKNSTVSTTTIANALKAQGLDSFYAVVTGGTSAANLAFQSNNNLLTNGTKYEIWHFQYTGVTGSTKSGVGDKPEIQYNITKKVVTSNGASSWGQDFGNN